MYRQPKDLDDANYKLATAQNEIAKALHTQRRQIEQQIEQLQALARSVYAQEVAQVKALAEMPYGVEFIAERTADLQPLNASSPIAAEYKNLK